MSGIYIYPSNSIENIELGIRLGCWAIPKQKFKNSVIGKAKKMKLGDHVLFYLTGAKKLYGIFRVTELPDMISTVSDIWEGVHELPFKFSLCSELEQYGSIYTPSLMQLLPSLKNEKGAWSIRITNFRGRTVFVKQPLTEDDMAALFKLYPLRVQVNNGNHISNTIYDDYLALPEEVLSTGIYEGALRSITINRFERSKNARDQCIAKHTSQCCICGFDFGRVYGPEFIGFIHVHHLMRLSEIRAEHQIIPEIDLRPVCPNCHAVIHYGGNMRSIPDVKILIDKMKVANI